MDQYPVVKLGVNHPGVLEPGMVISVEGYMGAVGGTVGAKYEEQIIITEGEPESDLARPGGRPPSLISPGPTPEVNRSPSGGFEEHLAEQLRGRRELRRPGDAHHGLRP